MSQLWDTYSRGKVRDRIKDLLPGRSEQVGRHDEDNRLFVKAVLYRYRTGIA